MRTLDEEIAHQREVAEKIRTEHNCECDYYDIDIDCVKCAEEHEQFAEWLEELKALRNGLKIKCDSLNEALEKGKKIGYNKALDDFVKFASDMPTVDEWDGTIRPMWLEEMAEKLKAGDNNADSN